MDWPTYKQACDQPQVLSRWMLEQTRDLLGGNAPLALRLTECLEQPSLPRPPDHHGGPATDMFELELTVAEVAAIHLAVTVAVREGRTTPLTRARGLGGFVEAWQELLRHLAR